MSLHTKVGSIGEQPLTRLKCVACCTLRTGCMSASRTTTDMSAPEYLHTLMCLETLVSLIVPFGERAQPPVVVLGQRTTRITHVQFENVGACVHLG
jgi:hypothetical protein